MPRVLLGNAPFPCPHGASALPVAPVAAPIDALRSSAIYPSPSPANIHPPCPDTSITHHHRHPKRF